MSGSITGKLILRIRSGDLGASGASLSCKTGDELVCKLEFEDQSSQCACTINEELKVGENAKDAVLDVPEYHGASEIKINVIFKRNISSSLGSRRSRFLSAVLKTKPRSQPRQVTQISIPLRDAIPSSYKAMARHAADAFDSGMGFKSASGGPWWGSTSHTAPRTWQDYWPSIDIPLGGGVDGGGGGGGVVNASILFVPLISPEKSLGGFTELHKAAYLGDAKLVSILLGPRCGSGASLSARTRDAMAATPLDLAVMQGHLDVALQIIADSSSGHLLFSHHSVVSSLSSYHSYSMSGNADRRTSLHHAVMGGNATLVGCLADHFAGSSPTFRRAEDSSSVFSSSEPIPLIDVEDANGWTPLMMACERPDMEEAIPRLVEAGANLELVNKLGDTALIIACKAGNVKCALALLEAASSVDNPSNPPENKASPARPNKPNYAGDRALDRACASGSCPTLIRALLDSFAVPALRRLDGSTALHVAAMGGYKENCEELIHWLDRERARMAASTGSLTEFVGTAIAQSLHLLLIRDIHGKFASEWASNAGHTQLSEWLKQLEARDAALFMPRPDEFRAGSDVEEDEYSMHAMMMEGEEEKRQRSTSSSGGGPTTAATTRRPASSRGEEEKRRS